MTLVSIPANPVPEDVVSGTIKTPDGAELRFARWAPPAGRKGTVCVFTGRSEQIEKYFETVRDLRERGFAVAMIDWRGQGHSSRRLRDPRKGYVRDFPILRSTSRASCSRWCCRIARRPISRWRIRWGRRHAAGGARRKTLVRPHGAVGADDRPAGTRHLAAVGRAFASAAMDRAGRPLHSGGSDALTGSESFINNPSPAIPCASRAMPPSSRRTRRSASVRRR